MGAKYVIRAAQSKGIADLVALFPNKSTGCCVVDGPHRCATVWMVQCKYSVKGGGTISPAEREELTRVAGEAHAVPIVATPGKNGRGIEFTNLQNTPPRT